MALQVAQLLKRPVTMSALERAVLCVNSATFLHGNQKLRDLVVVLLFLSRRIISSLLPGLIPTTLLGNVQLFELRCPVFG